ncbi:MAG TPA: hypothetical protein VKK31_08155 [Thermoanaerobaculia bacterium]|nr:hypothetical protein [Thermoanaerobaculia bacterium]
MRACHPLFSVALSLALLPALLGAQQLTLEAAAGAESFLKCQTAHSIGTCEVLHIETGATLSVGATVQLSGRSFVVLWTGPGYYLESGVILQPMGKTRSGLGGQRWLEVYPHEGRIHTSRSWKDKDGNQALSASDTLELDADRALTVKDVRLHLRVRPAAGK